MDRYIAGRIVSVNRSGEHGQVDCDFGILSITLKAARIRDGRFLRTLKKDDPPIKIIRGRQILLSYRKKETGYLQVKDWVYKEQANGMVARNLDKGTYPLPVSQNRRAVV